MLYMTAARITIMMMAGIQAGVKASMTVMRMSLIRNHIVQAVMTMMIMTAMTAATIAGIRVAPTGTVTGDHSAYVSS